MTAWQMAGCSGYSGFLHAQRTEVAALDHARGAGIVGEAQRQPRLLMAVGGRGAVARFRDGSSRIDDAFHAIF